MFMKQSHFRSGHHRKRYAQHVRLDGLPAHCSKLHHHSHSSLAAEILAKSWTRRLFTC